MANPLDTQTNSGLGIAALPFLQRLLQMGPTSPGQPTAPAMPPAPDSGALPTPPQPQQMNPQAQPQQDPDADLQEFQQQGQTKGHKGHKLLEILKGGLVGGLSGLAANAQTYAQTGRNAGFGGGVGAGFTQSLPFMQKLQGQELQRGGLENQILSSQAQYSPYQRFLEMLKSGADISHVQAQTGQATAEAGKATAEAGAIPTKTALEQAQKTLADAQAFAANYKEQNGILYNLQTGQPLTPDASGMVQTPADIAAAMGVKPGTRLPAKQISEARSAYYGHLNGSDPSIIAQIGPPPVANQAALVQWGKQAEAIKTREASAPRLNMIMARPTEVGDPNSPGNTKFVPGGQAMGMAGPQSASVQVPKKVAESATSGPISNTLMAFNTAIIHMQTFKQVADALENGDTLLANQIGQALGTQFGGNKATDFNIVKTAFAGEVGKAFAGANVAEGDRTALSDKINAASSPGQLRGYADTAEKLLRGKRDVVQQTVQKGMQGQPNFGDTAGGGAPLGASHAVVVNGKIVGYTSDGKTMTPVQ